MYTHHALYALNAPGEHSPLFDHLGVKYPIQQKFLNFLKLRTGTIFIFCSRTTNDVHAHLRRIETREYRLRLGRPTE